MFKWSRANSGFVKGTTGHPHHLNKTVWASHCDFLLSMCLLFKISNFQSSAAVQYSWETLVWTSAAHQRSPGSQTVSSHLKYLCFAPLHLFPIHLKHYLIRTSGLSPDVLLISFRFSLLPWCSTMHPLHYHQIFNTYWLGLMHCGPPAEFKLLISEGKLDWKKGLLIKVVRLANRQAFNLILPQFGCKFRRLEWKLSQMS